MDQFIGVLQNRRRDDEAEGFRSFQVHDQFKFCRLLIFDVTQPAENISRYITMEQAT